MPSLPYYLPIAGERIVGFIPFPKVLALREIQTVQHWYLFAMSISYDNNRYTTTTTWPLYTVKKSLITIRKYFINKLRWWCKKEKFYKIFNFFKGTPLFFFFLFKFNLCTFCSIANMRQYGRERFYESLQNFHFFLKKKKNKKIVYTQYFSLYYKNETIQAKVKWCLPLLFMVKCQL